MKEIPLSGKKGEGKFALVDDPDYPTLSKFRWHYDGRYACRKTSRSAGAKTMYMHREVLGLGKWNRNSQDNSVDHANGNGLDNRRCNIRICTQSQNLANARVLRKDNTSGHKGVSWHKNRKKWRAYVAQNGNLIHLGYFSEKNEAVSARKKAHYKLHGNFAHQ